MNELEILRAAAYGLRAQADECDQKIAELTGTPEPVSKPRGRPRGSGKGPLPVTADEIYDHVISRAGN